ncbi:MAG: helix-turn-helix domain-containing protein [Sodaliphilus sp.]
MSQSFWLQVKKEYIDENLEAFIDYLSKSKHDEQNTDYQLTINALAERVDDLLHHLASMPLYAERIEEDDRNKWMRLITAQLLVSGDINAFVGLCRLMAQSGQIPGTDISNMLTEHCVGCLKYVEISKLAVGWTDIKDKRKFLPQVLAAKIANTTFKIVNPDVLLYFQNKGLLRAQTNEITLSAFNFKDYKQIRHLEPIMPAVCEIKIVDNQNERLGTSNAGNIKKVDSACMHFISQMASVKPSPVESGSKRKQYQYGDLVCIKITKASPQAISAVSVDPEYEQLEGTVFVDKIVQGINQKEFFEFFSEQFYMHNEVLIMAEYQSHPKFPFFLRPAVSEYYTDLATTSKEKEMVALCIGKYSVGYRWLTENGLLLNIIDTDTEVEPMGYHENVVVREHIFQNSNCIINGKYAPEEYVDNPNELPEEEFVKEAHKRFLEGFMEWTQVPDCTQKQIVKLINPHIIRHCIPVIYHDALLCDDTVQKYKTLALALMLCTLVDDKENADFLRFELKYITAVADFAQSGPYKVELKLEAKEAFEQYEDVQKKLEIVNILNHYKFQLIQTTKKPQLQLKREVDLDNIGKLVEAANTLNGIIPLREIDAIKHAIAKNLFVDDEYESIIDDKSEFGEEDDTQEFKTTIVYPPNNNERPLLKRQLKNVLNAVCGFLNSQKGGCVLIGVNDAGEVTGIDRDIQYLLSQRLITDASADKYRLFLEERVENAFFDVTTHESGRDVTGLFVTTNILSSQKTDKHYLRVDIKPYEYGVVAFQKSTEWEFSEEMEDSYMRKSGRTVKLTEALKAQLIERRLKKSSDDLQKIQAIKLAIEKKKMRNATALRILLRCG